MPKLDIYLPRTKPNKDKWACPLVFVVKDLQNCSNKTAADMRAASTQNREMQARIGRVQGDIGSVLYGIEPMPHGNGAIRTGNGVIRTGIEANPIGNEQNTVGIGSIRSGLKPFPVRIAYFADGNGIFLFTIIDLNPAPCPLPQPLSCLFLTIGHAPLSCLITPQITKKAAAKQPRLFAKTFSHSTPS